MKLFLKYSMLALSMVMFTACMASVVGNGVIKTQQRKVPTFSSVAVGGSYAGTVTVGKRQRVSLTSDSNLLPLIITEVHDGTLKVRTKLGQNISPTKTNKLNVAVRKLHKLDFSGSTDFKVTKIKGKRLYVDISGSGKLQLAGKIKQLYVTLSGSGNIDARQLISNSAQINISGSGNVIVNAKQKLRVDISGAGKVQYLGSPTSVDQHVSGSGTLVKVS